MNTTFTLAHCEAPRTICSPPAFLPSPDGKGFLSHRETVGLSLLLLGGSKPFIHRQDVALAVRLGSTIGTPSLFETCLAMEGRTASLRPRDCCRSSIPLQLVVAQVHAGVLPARELLVDSSRRLWGALTGAVEACQADIFRLCSVYYFSTRDALDLCRCQRRDLIVTLAASRTPRQYLKTFPMREIIGDLSPHETLHAAQRSAIVFEETCRALTELGFDLEQQFFGPNPVNYHYFACAEEKVFLEVLKYYRAEDYSTRLKLFFAAFFNAMDPITGILVRWLSARGISVFVTDQDSAAALRAAGDYERDIDADPPRKLIFLLEECTSIGFNLAQGMTALLRQRGKSVSFMSLPTFRYIVRMAPELQRVVQNLNHQELVEFYCHTPLLQFCVDELHCELPKAAALEELLISILSSTAEGGYVCASTLFLVQRMSMDALSPAIIFECVRLLGRRSYSSSLTELQQVVVLLRYFVGKGWVQVACVDQSGEGMQHMMSLMGCMSQKSRSPMTEFLIDDLQLNFAQLTPTGEFALSLALQRHALDDACLLVKRRLLPPKSILRKYRSPQYQTILTLVLNLTKTVFLGVCDIDGSVEQSITLGEDILALEELCDGIGLDVIRDLSKVPCTLNLSHGFGPGKPSPFGPITFPLALACQRWPLAAIRYLVEEVKVEGSTGVPLLNVLSHVSNRPEMERYLLGLVD